MYQVGLAQFYEVSFENFFKNCKISFFTIFQFFQRLLAIGIGILSGSVIFFSIFIWENALPSISLYQRFAVTFNGM